MTKIQDDLVFLKWQLLSRLPKGSIYERVKQSLLNDNILSDDPFYYIYWLDINRSLLKKYLFGTFGTTNSDYDLFIKWLDEKYAKNDFYEINVDNSTIKIPIPLYQDYKCFKAEFLDIIMPYLVKDENMSQPFLEGPYEYHDVRVSDSDTVFDIGANFGLFSCLASSRNCDVYAFEPTQRIVNQYLSRLQNKNSNIKIINKAVSNYTGTSLFKDIENNSSCNSLQQSDNNYKKEVNLVKVDTVTVDDFVLHNKLNKVDFIKADIEGAERLMLEGAKETLREFAPKLAICHYHRLDDLKVLRRLILEANPNYEKEVNWKKIYAKVPKK